jgi:hypothetical protein
VRAQVASNTTGINSIKTVLNIIKNLTVGREQRARTIFMVGKPGPGRLKNIKPKFLNSLVHVGLIKVVDCVCNLWGQEKSGLR